ncbi:DUF3343 domain-containing protein [Lachnospiraceae bacterium LCP25S3_G4]
MEEMQYYVLFHNHDNGMRLHRELKCAGVRAKIAPTPRSVSTCCGISLLIRKEDVKIVEECVKEHNIEIIKIVEIKKDLNPHRDKFC